MDMVDPVGKVDKVDKKQALLKSGGVFRGQNPVVFF
jgi:hypothetical protein